MSTESSGDAPQRKKRRRGGIDWEAVRRDYEFSDLTLTELSVRHNVTMTYISKKANAEGWARDVRSKAKKATAAALTEEISARLEHATGRRKPTEPLQPLSVEEAAARAVEAIVDVNKQILLRHHERFGKAGKAAEGLLDELMAQAGLVEHTELLARILAGEEPDAVALAKARDAIERTMDVMRRATALSKIADTLVKLADAERKNLGLDEPDAPKPVDQTPFSQIPPEKRMEAVMGLLRG